MWFGRGDHSLVLTEKLFLISHVNDLSIFFVPSSAVALCVLTLLNMPFNINVYTFNIYVLTAAFSPSNRTLNVGEGADVVAVPETAPYFTDTLANSIVQRPSFPFPFKTFC